MRLLFVIGAALLLVALACFPSHPQSTFDAAGPVARSQLNLFYIIFWVAVVVFVVVQGIMVYAVIRFRRKQGQDQIPAQIHGNTRLEIAWTIAPAIVLAVVAVPTVITIFDNARIPDLEDAVQVKVTGHQWWWEFEYFTSEEIAKEEADRERVGRGEIERAEAYKPVPHVVTANELNIPVGVPVSVVLESDDVIHSFWIPKLAGKVDVVPNNRNTIWFQADEPGTYFGVCAEFCGIAHAQMRFRVIAVEEPAFKDWIESQQAPPAAMAPVMGLKGCLVCHTVNGLDAPGIQQTRMDAFLRGDPRYPAPNLTFFASRSTFAGGVSELTEANLREWLEDPDKVKPGNHMAELAGAYTDPNLVLKDEDIDALVAYLLSLE